MSDKLKDISSNLSTGIDQETLLLYLKGQLAEDKKQEVERHLIANEFTDEALEGLRLIKDDQKISLLVEQLNRELKLKLKKKKTFRDKLKYKDQPWLYISLLIILLLIVISYLAIYRILHQ